MPKSTTIKPYDLLGLSKSGYHRKKRANPRLVARLLRDAQATQSKPSPTTATKAAPTSNSKSLRQRVSAAHKRWQQQQQNSPPTNGPTVSGTIHDEIVRIGEAAVGPETPMSGTWVEVTAANDPRPKVAEVEVQQRIHAAVRQRVACAMLNQIKLDLHTQLDHGTGATLVLTEAAAVAVLNAVEDHYGRLLRESDIAQAFSGSGEAHPA